MATTTTTVVEYTTEGILPLTSDISPLILPCSVQCDHADPDTDADADISEPVLSCAAWSLGLSGYEADESLVGLSSGPSSSSEADEEWEDEEQEGGKEEPQVTAVPFSLLGDAVYASPDEYQDDDDDDDRHPTALTAPPPLSSTVSLPHLSPHTPTRPPPSETTALLLAATAIPAYTSSRPGSGRGKTVKKKYKTSKARRTFHRRRGNGSPNVNNSGFGRPVSRMRYGPVPVLAYDGGYESFPEFEVDGAGGVCRWFC
jgi:hypothetical protein